MDHIKNLSQSPQSLKDIVSFKPHQVVSKAISKSENVSITVLAFPDDEGVSEEAYQGDTIYFVLEGEMPIYINKSKYLVKLGEYFVAPSGVLHKIGYSNKFKVVQITIIK